MQRCFAILLVGLLGACSSPGPTPVDFARRSLPATNLDPTAKEHARKDTERALWALRDGQGGLAQRLVESVIVRDPRAARARAILGICLVAVAKRTTPAELAVMERAEGEILLARRIAPKDELVQLLHAEFLEADGQVSLAAEALDNLLAARPDHREALRAASRLRFELGEERLALPLLNRLLDLIPADAESVYRLAHCQLRLAEALARNDTPNSNQPKDAAKKSYLTVAETFKRYQKLKPNDVDGYLGEVHARFLAGPWNPSGDEGLRPLPELVDVFAILDAASKVDPESPAPDHSRGVILEHFKEPARARAAYEAALAKDSKFLPSTLNLARLLDTTGDKRAARVYCQRALELGVSNSERNRLEQYLNDTAK